MLMPIWTILLFTNLNADNTPRVDSDSNGGIFLYRESVEMYWDDWVSYPLMDRRNLPSNDQVESLIKGEGKTALFYGVLSINCNNAKHYWEGIPSDGGDALNDSNINNVVPNQVINNAITLFCKR